MSAPNIGAYSYPRLARDEPLSFKDRFANAVLQPAQDHIIALCEQTLSNELETALPEYGSYLARYGRYVLPRFRSERFRQSLSPQGTCRAPALLRIVMHDDRKT